MYACMCSSDDCRRFGCAAKRSSGAAVGSPLADLGKIGFTPQITPTAKPAAPDAPAKRIQPTVRQGWECPRCKAILAPHVDRCTCNGAST